ncbi:MAG: UvrD-helicase domain-containing protein [Desulfovibrionales bacterium]
MDQFRADLHIHSRFSRATSKSLTPRNLAAWARVKGIDVVGTGDFTHPGWLAQLEEQLQEDGSGLLTLRSTEGLSGELPWKDYRMPSGTVRFMLSAEISSIYKRGGKVRKVHNLVYMPSIERARQFNERLGQIGNLESDGRPILGLDSEHLLEMVLETDPLAFLVPAHIWTPWFSLFGSKSGFDAIEECFGSLSKEIFALETGLSSDPEMNWLWSKLDRFKLISNSDAHSGENLGRELNLFSGTPSYEGIYRALRGEGLGHKFLGTMEFFPEEGKYHMDGHRKCGVVMDPRESLARGCLCTGCGKPITVGVLNRVLTLADRETPERPSGQPGFTSLIPLTEILSEIVGTGPKTKKVRTQYAKAIERFGSEMTILQRVPPEELATFSPLLAEGITRMRSGRVRRQPGFDGQFGKISVFSAREINEIRNGKLIYTIPRTKGGDPGSEATGQGNFPLQVMQNRPAPPPTLQFNTEQQGAIQAGPGPVLVLAGPGTGKTHTLLGRVRHLVEQGITPRQILILTFTRRAAEELKSRLLSGLGKEKGLPQADTLHALAFENWTAVQGQPPVIMSEEDSLRIFLEANPGLSKSDGKKAWTQLGAARERLDPLPEELQELARTYAQQKNQWNLVDYTDLLEFWREQIQSRSYYRPYTHILVDEIQDLTPLQLDLIKVLAPPGGNGFFAIGDANQSIYSFRGAVTDVRANLAQTWDELEVITLRENYRSCQNILNLCGSLFPGQSPLEAVRSDVHDLHFFQAGTGAHEAVWIGDRIRTLIGGTAHWQADLSQEGACNPGDIAVMFRFKGLMPLYQQTLTRMGIPCAIPEDESFWVEPRVKLILDSVGRLLGLFGEKEGFGLQCPDRVLAQGPSGLSAYLKDIPPFDQLFWKSTSFLKLKRMFEEQGGWSGLLNWIHLQTELEQVRGRAEKIQLMSMHAAKGLEFEAVFLPALEDGILPFAGKDLLSGKLEDGEMTFNEEEEKRLFYVGLSRAKSRLYLSCAGRRRVYGKHFQLPPSRFCRLLPKEMLTQTAMVARKVQKARQLSMF